MHDADADAGITAVTADAGVDAGFQRLYAQLQSVARRELRRSARGTLDTVALVNETYLKLAGKPLDSRQDGQFIVLAAKAMRHVLVDHLRARSSLKRGGEQVLVTLQTESPIEAPQQVDLLELEQGLCALEQLDPRLVTVVECHFYGGMEFADIASQFGSSERTVYRQWRKARAFLQAQLEEGE